jgi:hypothetical protein
VRYVTPVAVFIVFLNAVGIIDFITLHFGSLGRYFGFY